MKNKLKRLEEISATARHLMVDSLICAGCGHPGGAFSSVEALVALYFEAMKIRPKNPKWNGRDRFILSKGHSSVALYAVLSLRGFFRRDVLATFRQNGSSLGGHPNMHNVPGVEMSTGSLGHGLSIGAGLALAAKMDCKRFRTFVLMGDGETQEGSIWEAAMFSSHYKLDNLVGIVDRNCLQMCGSTETMMALEPYRDKWAAFGWSVKSADGHNMREIVSVLEQAPFKKNKPSLVILNTVKGKGISFMENDFQWHSKAISGKYIAIARREVARALKEAR